MKLENSKALLARAEAVIPSASQTFSKGPDQQVRGVAPYSLMRGDGAWVWDVDGNKYLDMILALGPMILGYNHPEVNQAVKDQIDQGTTFSLPHPLEVEVAEKLVDLIPCAEMVRFGKNGTDATSAAVRVARAYTGKDLIAVCGYHGWQDWYIATTTRDRGIPKAVKELTKSFVYNDLSSLENLLTGFSGQFAAIVMEPIGVIAPDKGFLEGVRRLASQHNIVLIFDEVLCGIRFDLGGVQKYLGVTPDIACFGKAIANGYPLSAIVGQRDIMKVFDDIFFSGTFGGETLSLRACQKTLEVLERDRVIERNWEIGDDFNTRYRDLIGKHGLNDHIRLDGFGVRSLVNFIHQEEDQMLLRKSYYYQECVKRGLLYFGQHNICWAHNQAEIDFALNTFDNVLGLFADAQENNDFSQRLEGPVIAAVFRKS